jgi:glycosyltransferase involved in cell wall biosynthesis
MKLARPVIAARGGGTEEQIEDGSNGMLYPPGDWSALADKVETLITDANLRRRMAERALEWSTRTFTPERYASEMRRVLEEAVR